MPQFYYIKVGFKGVFIAWTCFPDDSICNNTIGRTNYNRIIIVDMRIALGALLGY